MRTPRARPSRAVVAAGAVLVAALVAVLGVAVVAGHDAREAAALRAERAARNSAMFAAEARYVPAGVASLLKVHYDHDPRVEIDSRLTLNAFRPADVRPGALLPTVVWIHGGAWVGGGASELTNHLKIIAARGYTTIGVNYTLAPTTHYPTPLRQIMTALAFVRAHAAALHADPSRLVLAGDSAGAQLAAQTTAMIEDPAYAARVGVRPGVPVGGIRAVVLFCGVYDWSLKGVHGTFRRFLQDALHLYTGSADPAAEPRLATGSVVHDVPRGFPPTFVSAGNADPVLAQSTAFVAALRAQAVPVDTLFFAHGYRPGLPHEYEFRLGLPAGRLALDRTLAFLGAHGGVAAT